MKPKPTIKTKLFFLFFLVVGSVFMANAQEAVPFTPRLAGDNIKIRGDIIFVGNNILNRATEADPGQANTPYNGSQNNNSLWMEYIDIDGDPSTFSSSSAELNISDPSCSQVRYAGLYWAATYPNERSDSSQPFNGTPRIEDWFNIKFRIPGGTYVDLTADTAADPVGQEDDIIFDGYDYNNINNSFKDSPYICYKNVTDLVRSNTNPNGEYTAANIRATKGRRNGSSSAGWVMVIIYENPNESGKFISTFDGYAGLSGSVGNVDVDVDGFRTLPAPFTVRARIGVGALEGDRGIRNDRFFIRSDMNSGNPFTNLSTGNNPANNFFNSTITENGNQVPTRTPYGTNTLGLDLDLFNLNNPPVNTVLPNDETGATLRFTSTGDGYGAFLASFSVEIIEPNIVLEKRVEDIGGNDITGMGVNLGQTLDYVLSFRNLGNDDATGIDPTSSDPFERYYTIRDVLPVNVTLDELNITMPTGVIYTYDSATNEITFAIPDNLVVQGQPVSSIRMRVRVAENCFDFVDACSDLIENLAYSTYAGVENTAVITDDPSVSDFDNCGFVTPGATNFLLDDLSACNFTRNVLLCGDDVLLDAGDGFDNYIWVRDDNGNGQLDPTDTVLDDGDPDGDPSTLLVDDIGTYIVDKQVADPCKGFKEIIIVERFGTTQTNPIIDIFNDRNSDADPDNDIQGEIVQCSIDGDFLPKLFLCGSNDDVSLQVNITDADSIRWERLSDTCTQATEDCAYKDSDPGCTWSTVANGSNFSANTAGNYRIIINYQNGCSSRFYFNVFQNTLDIQYNKRDIICTTDGNITITNLGLNYGYRLVDVANSTILVDFDADNGPSFDIATNGAYRVDVVQLDVNTGDPIPGACIFSTPDIGILDRNFQVDLTTTMANCNAQGTIKIDALNVFPNYSYELRLDDGTPPPPVGSPSYYPGHPGGTFIDDETAQPSNTHTFNVNADDYFIISRSDDGCLDVQSVTVGRVPDPSLEALTTSNIGCTAGTIELTVTGGQGNPDFLYTIWSKDGTDLYTDITDIPADAYQVDSTFYFGWRDEDGDGTDEYFPNENGDYEFIVVDANGCYAISNVATMEDRGQLAITSIDQAQPSCSGFNDGSITINTSGGVGDFQYSINNGANYQDEATFVGLSEGNYTIRVLDESGCDVSQPISLSAPFPLSAAVGVSRDVTCNPAAGAEVRVTNVVGGTSPYEYSFDGGGSYGPSSTANLAPGTYTVIVRDAGNCTFPMTVDVEDLPQTPIVTLTPTVDYNCNGTGDITMTPDITTYDYTYELDGVLNTPPDNNTFTNLVPGTYTVTTNYKDQTPPTPSVLLIEDFGYGDTVPSPNTTGYFYENQQDDVTPSGAPVDPNRSVNDYEYAVTDSIARPFGAWLNPIDHTTGTRATNGRYLVINIGSPGPGEVIYSKTVNDIIPDQPLAVSLWAINLLRSTHTGQVDPDLTIELRHPVSNALIASADTGTIARNDIWNQYVLPLDPGSNTSLDLVIITNESNNSGNDVAIDDILVEQTPEVCELSIDTVVEIEAGEAFAANFISATNASCNGVSDGTITFEVENFDTGTGFEYSVDGGTIWIPETTSPVTTAAIYGAGSHTIQVRRANEITCTASVTHTITEPNALVASAGITTQLTCTNGGATITASATDGTPAYEYQLEDTGGTPIGTYDFANNGTNNVFTGILDGNYIVRVRDANNCEDVIDAALNVAATDPILFNITETACYSGNNDGTIQVDVTSGNGNYEFQLNGNPWVAANTLPTRHIFAGLSAGNYTINVKDGLGCEGTAVPVTIDAHLSATIDVVDISSCADGSITATATGGEGALQYAFVTSGTPVTGGDFGPSNTYTVTAGNDGAYDVYVRDSTLPTSCEFMDTVTVDPADPLAFTATPTDPECHDGTGSIEVDITAGDGPYTIQIIDLDNGGASDQTDTNVVVTNKTYFNLLPGDYTINITDANSCVSTQTPITIVNPDELTATIVGVTPATCTGDPNDFGFQFTGYPGTLGTIEFSDDGGATWIGDNSVPGTSDIFTGYVSGNTVTPAMRTTDGSGNTVCLTVLPEFIIPYPLDDLDITVTAVVVNCNELQVTVQGSQGTAPYQYTYSDDPANFNPAAPTFPWTTPPTGLANPHTFFGLIPGRTYTFYVRDDVGCVRQSNVNVNDLITVPLDITSTYEPTCFGASTGSITYTVTDNQAPFGTEFRWEVFDMSSGSAVSVADSGGNVPYTSPQDVTVSGLPAGNYFIQVTEVDGGSDSCVGATENLLLEELNAINGTPSVIRDITCADPGLVEIQSIFGGGGTYTYTLSSANFVANIVSTDNPVEVPIGNLVNTTATPFNIDVSVVDQYGCPANLGTVSIDISQSPTIDSIVVDNCAVPFSITVNASGGTAPYLYSNNGGVNYIDNGGVFNNVAVGTYNIAVIDANGCSVVSPTATEVYPALEASASLTKLLDCTASPDAEITIEITAGSGNYDYQISDGTGIIVAKTALPSNPFVYSTPTVENYIIEVYDNDAVGCAPRSFTVEVPNRIDPVLNIDNFANETCDVSDDGSITVSAADNGISPVVFQITAVDGSPLGTPINPTSNTTTTATFTGLTGTVVGTNYTITGTGANNCPTAIDQLILEPQPITVNAIVPVEYGCASGNNVNNASLTFAGANGGSNNFVRYEFIRDGNPVQDGTDPTWVETDFAGGNYVINVYDDNGCVGSTTATIDPFDELQSASVVLTTAPSCSGEDIRIDAVSSITNSTADPANYEFRELPSGTFGPSNLFNNLSVGVHVFQVRNIATGCVINVTHEVQEPNTFDIVIDKISDVVCHGTDSGSITLELTDATYVGPFDWEIFDTNGTPDISDDTSVLGPNTSPDNGPTAPIALFAGTYRVRVTQNNAPNCFNDKVFTITTPDAPITATVNQTANVTCTNDQGKILVDPEGGVGPYTITIDSGTQTLTQTNVFAHIFEGLSAGTFAVTITDALGCVNTTYSQILTMPTPIVANISPSYTLDCVGDNDGVVSATVTSGGFGTIQYQLNVLDDTGTNIVSSSVLQLSNTFTGLSAGNYSITIVDDGNCGDTFGPTTISDPTEVTALLVRTSPLTCQTDAELELRASGGTAPYYWSLDDTGTSLNAFNGGNVHTFTNVTAGTYQYYVYDDNSCISVISNQITEDPIMDVTVEVDETAAVINCTGDNTAIIYADADGGVGDYRYELYNAYNGTALNVADRIQGPFLVGEFSGLTAGTYWVNVTSGVDCVLPDPYEVNITEPAPLQVTSSFTNVTCMDADDGTITVELSGGSGGYQYAISPNLNQFDIENTFTDLEGSVTGITYTVIAQDINGCFEQLEFTIFEPEALDATASVTHEICQGDEDGSITLNITGGTAPYRTALNSNADADFVQDQTQFDFLAAGTYVVFIRDAQDCETNVIVEVESGVNLNATITPIYECTGDTPNNYVNITMEDESVLGDVMYALDSTDSADMQLTPDFRDIAPGQHYIAIVSVSNGCLRTFDFEIEGFEPLTLSLEQNQINEITAVAGGGKEGYSFTFDGVDNGSDTTYFINRTDTYTVTVTDENGCSVSAEIFMEFIDIEIPNFFTPDGDGLNDFWVPRNQEAWPQILTIIFDRYGREVYRMGLNDAGWDGIYQNTELPTGDYWYIIKLRGESDDREFVGHFTLYR